MEENPPLPEEMPQEKKRVAYMTQEMKLSGENKIEGGVLVNMPERADNAQKKEK